MLISISQSLIQLSTLLLKLLAPVLVVHVHISAVHAAIHTVKQEQLALLNNFLHAQRSSGRQDLAFSFSALTFHCTPEASVLTGRS